MASPIPRRTALVVGAVGVGAGLVALASCDPEQRRRLRDGALEATAPTSAPAWVEPLVLTSASRVLEVEMRVEEDSVAVAGGTARMLAYHGTVPGPTLHLRPGDTLKVRLVNAMATPTNLHTHGLDVSPAGAGDNPFVSVAPGETYDYRFVLPLDHPQGVFWYHPHRHGTVADQVFGGLYGAIVVDRHDWTEAAPRIVLISDTTLAGGRVAAPTDAERTQGRIGETVLTNGKVAPRLAAKPGSTERWLVINACVSRYLDLDLGGREVTVRALDAGAVEPPRRVDRLVLAPGNRADLEVIIPQAQVDLVSHAYAIGHAGHGMMRGRVSQPEDAVLLTLVPDPAATARRGAGPAAASSPDLRERPVDGERTLELGMGMGIGGMRFLIDGREFDPERTDQAVAQGAVERWTLRNTTPMDHPFHLHVWPMQVVRRGGVDVEGVEIRDVVDVPAGEEVVVRIAFGRVGRSVYHCHILDHEDAGMMGVVEVTRQSTS